MVGGLLGLPYPFVATVAVVLQENLSPTFSSLVELHQDRLLLQIIDSMPILLAMLLGLVGRSSARVENLVVSLEARVKARTAELHDSKDAAEATARARSRFLARLSRDISSSMESIVRGVEIVLGSSLDAKQHEHVSNSAKLARRVQDAMQSIQIVSEIDAGDVEIHERAFSPRSIVEDTVARVQRRLARKFELDVQCSEDLPPQASGDSVGIIKILMTLLRATVLNLEGGTIHLSASQTRGETSRSAILHLEVHAPELHISSKAAEHLFDAFERDDPMDLAQDSKLELELAVARRIATSLHGDVRVTTGTHGTRMQCSVPFRVGITDVAARGDDVLELDLETMRAS